VLFLAGTPFDALRLLRTGRERRERLKSKRMKRGPLIREEIAPANAVRAGSHRDTEDTEKS